MSAMEKPDGLRAFLLQVLWQLIPALVVYFGLRAFEVAPYLALCAAVVFALGHMVVDLLRGREVDFFVLAIILLYAVSAIITFVTKNPRYAQVANMLPGATADVALLASVLVGRPLTRTITAQYSPALALDRLPRRGWSEQDIRRYSAMHRSVSLVCGALGSAQVAASLAVIFTCSVDVAQLVCDVAGTGTTVLIVVYAVRRIRRFIADLGQGVAQDQTAAPVYD